MKKISTFLVGCTLLSSTVFGQVLIDEDFEGSTFPPTDWTSYDEDGLTSSSTQFNGSWEQVNLTQDGTFQAVSGSEYTTTGASDDWLITPQFSVPSTAGEVAVLTFVYATLTGPAPAILEVRVSTTGNAVADFTDVFMIDGNSQANALQARFVSLADYAGEDIYVAFRDRTDNAVAAVIDDVLIEMAPANSISLSRLTFLDHAATDGTHDITGLVVNNGGAELNNFDVTWTMDGVENTGTVEFTNALPPFTAAYFTAPNPLDVTGIPRVTDVDVTISNPNGAADDDDSDNTLSTEFTVQYGSGTAKKAVLEEFTTVPCGFCPEGADIVEEAAANNADVIPIGVHACFNTDVMTIPQAEDLCAQFSSGAPTSMIDRIWFHGEAQVGTSRGALEANGDSRWVVYSDDRANVSAPVSVDINGDYNAGSGEASVTVTTSFTDFMPGDIRVTLAIVEDNVTGGSAYDQRNFFNDGGFGPGPWVGQGDPLVGYNHRHVLRDLLPNTFGRRASWEQDVLERQLNQPATEEFNFTLDSDWDDNEVTLVAIVSRFGGNDNSKYEIVNAEKVKITELIAVGVTENIALGDDLEIYPNPATDVTNLKLTLTESSDVEVSLFDITGKQLRYEDYGKIVAGSQIFPINVSDLANGFYFVNLTIGDEVITRKISVNK